MKKASIIALTLLVLLSFWEFLLPVKERAATSSKAPARPTKSYRKKEPTPVNDFYEQEEISTYVIHNILDLERNFIARTNDIFSLRKRALSKGDERALLKHLETIHEGEQYNILNDIIEHMVRYGTDQKYVGQTLLKILNNPDQDQVTREYILQYIPEYYTARWNNSKSWDASEDQDRQEFNRTMWEMTDLNEGCMAGAALFALREISSKYEDLSISKVFEKSHAVVSDPSYSSPNRMGAVQVLAFSDNEQYFETAKQIVLGQKGAELLQVTAMNTALQSKFIDEELLSYIQEVADGRVLSPPALKRCAQLTVKKLNK